MLRQWECEIRAASQGLACMNVFRFVPISIDLHCKEKRIEVRKLLQKLIILFYSILSFYFISRCQNHHILCLSN